MLSRPPRRKVRRLCYLSAASIFQNVSLRSPIQRGYIAYTVRYLTRMSPMKPAAQMPMSMPNMSMPSMMPSPMGMPMASMMPMMCQMTCTMTGQGMMCSMMPTEGMSMDMMKSMCAMLTDMMACGTPVGMMCAGMPMMSCCGMAMMPKMTCTMTAKGMDCMMMPTGMMSMEMLKMCCDTDEPHDGLRHADDDDVRQYALHGLHELILRIRPNLA